MADQQSVENSPLRVALLSGVDAAVNPYVRLLCDAVTDTGKVAAKTVRPPMPRLEAEAAVIHLHWLEHWDRPPFTDFEGFRRSGNPVLRWSGQGLVRAVNHPWVFTPRRAWRLLRFLRWLVRYQGRGGRAVYTAHNLSGHDEENSWLETWGQRNLIQLADAVHVHDETAAAKVAIIRKTRRRVVVIPHANYVGVYANEVSRQEARQALGVAENHFVYLFLGQVRPYKGLQTLIPAFGKVSGEESLLLIAGQARRDYEVVIRRLAATDLRVRLDARFVAPERIQVYMNAADIVVLPYHHITTSGAAMLAFSFGKPVLAPAIGGFPALISPEYGILYDPTKPDALVDALLLARETDWTARRRDILDWVRQFDWQNVAPQFVALYKDLVRDDAGRT